MSNVDESWKDGDDEDEYEEDYDDDGKRYMHAKLLSAPLSSFFTSLLLALLFLLFLLSLFIIFICNLFSIKVSYHFPLLYLFFKEYEEYESKVDKWGSSMPTQSKKTNKSKKEFSKNVRIPKTETPAAPPAQPKQVERKETMRGRAAKQKRGE
jgi:hypothetical protein